MIALNAGDLATAKAKFTEAIEKNPEYGQAYGGMARVLWKEEAWQPALDNALKSVQYNPEDTEINQVLYAAYNGLGQKDKAAEILKKMQADNPEKAGLNMFNQAADLYNSGNIAEAKKIFEAIVAGQPNHAKTHYMLGICYVGEDNKAKAKEHFEQVPSSSRPTIPTRGRRRRCSSTCRSRSSGRGRRLQTVRIAAARQPSSRRASCAAGSARRGRSPPRSPARLAAATKSGRSSVKKHCSGLAARRLLRGAEDRRLRLHRTDPVRVDAMAEVTEDVETLDRFGGVHLAGVGEDAELEIAPGQRLHQLRPPPG